MCNTTYRNASQALPSLLGLVLNEGHERPSRNGAMRELTMQQLTLTHPQERYLTTPERRASLPAQIAETMWLLAGRDDIGWLSNYLPRAKDFSDDGLTWRGAYGPRLRGWDVRFDSAEGKVDQLAHVVQLLREDPTTRRAVLSIYDPARDTAPGKDIPCNNWFHLLARDGKLNGHVAIRSNDVFWGWSGINAFEWSALLEIVAGLVGLEVGSLTFSTSSLHLYERHYARANTIIDESVLSPVGGHRSSPPFSGEAVNQQLPQLDGLVQRWFRVEAIIRTEPRGSAWNHIKAFPEPMLRSWLFALYAWWHAGDAQDLREMLYQTSLLDTDLGLALLASPARKRPAKLTQQNPFTDFVVQLHAEKHAAYGDSWQRRGEQIGIMANCARKVDRLGVAGAGDTAADTAIDLLVYLVKYRLWLADQDAPLPDAFDTWPSTALSSGPEHVAHVETMLRSYVGKPNPVHSWTERDLVDAVSPRFDTLERHVVKGSTDRWRIVDNLISVVHPLAVRLWTKEQKDDWKAGNAARSWKGYDTEEAA